MNRLTGILFVALVMSGAGAAHAQEWQTYTYPDPGFAIQFPGVPEVQTTRFKNAVGVTLPVTRYVVRQDGVQYTLSVVNYSSTNADALSIIGEAVRSFGAKGKVNANAGVRVNGSSGRELTVIESDGSRSDVAIFFFDHHLYTAVGQALPPNPAERSADTARFRESLQFLGDDSGFFGLFGGRARTTPNTTANTVSTGRRAANDIGAGSGNAGSASAVSAVSSASAISTRSNAGEHSMTAANQRADAACAGKSAGDLVQLETPAGRVPATCTLTARPNPPSGSTPDGPPAGRNSDGPRNAVPSN